VSREAAVVWLGEMGCDDPVLVGAKAATLSRAARRHRVPPGFCLIAAGGRPPEEGSERVALAAGYAELARRCGRRAPLVAVRSSAVGEDDAGASFAGQHRTELGVAGIGAIAAAVERCRSSASSPHALEYRRRQGLPSPAGPTAVVVQELVAADASAVAFIIDPVTGRDDAAVIEATWGLGDALAAGTVSPDRYRVARRRLAVVERRVAEKQTMKIVTEAGVVEAGVPRELRSAPALTDDQALVVARLVLDLEAGFGAPVDVECAVAGELVHLLQCRPVTGLHGAVGRPV
jgi:phosphoenolpyruvate synthase/pyruvate phosphate dikinase